VRSKSELLSATGIAFTVTFMSLIELTTRPSTGDVVYWSTLGTPNLQFTTPQSSTSTAGTTGTVNFNGAGALGEQQNGIIGTFSGDFAPGDLVITTYLAPLTISFNTPVQEAGAQIQDTTIGDHFTAEILAYSGNTLLGSFTENGFSGDVGDNSDIFLGVQSTTANITSIVFLTFTGDPPVQQSVAINQLTIDAPPAPLDHWTNSQGGNWSTAANWNPGVPTATLNAEIDAAGSYPVAITKSAIAYGLLLNDAGATVTDNSGPLTLSGSGGTNGALTINAGTFILNGGGLNGSISIGSGGALQIAKGTYALSETITNNGSITDKTTATITGNISGTGTILAQNTANLTIASSLTGSENVTLPEQHGGSITTNALSQVMTNEQQFLANPHHG
jgi:hypothetical protein